MKNDILLFAIMCAVAWVGYDVLKERLPQPVADDSSNPAIADAGGGAGAKSMLMPADNGDIPASSEPNAAPVKDMLKTKQTLASAQSADEASRLTIAPPPLTAKQEIAKLLADQITGWNRGDLDAFMDAYWKNESLTFSGAGETTVGWDDTYANYRARYPEGQMGQIEFSDLKTEMVGTESAIVTGRFEHQLIDEKVRGNFSLVLKAIDSQWKIIHDHTSVAR